MNTGIRIQIRKSPALSEAALRRLHLAIWLATMFIAVALSIRILPDLYRDTLNLTQVDPSQRAEFRANLAAFGISNKTLTVIALIGQAAVGASLIGLSLLLLLKRKADDWFAFYVSIVMVSGIGAVYPPDLHGYVDGQLFWLIAGKTLTGLTVTGLVLIPLLFPTGRFVPRWMVVPAAFFVFEILSFVIAPGADASGGLSPALEIASNAILLLLICGSIVYRFRHKSSASQRQQMKWGAVGAAISVPLFLAGDAMMRNIDGSFTGMLCMLGFSLVMPLGSLVFPVCLTIGILRFGLWDIDLIISRSLVWLIMSALVVGGYITLVIAVGDFFTDGHSTALSLLAVGIIAVLFQPLRSLIQRSVDRRLFGDRGDPYRVVRKLGSELAETIQPIEALRATVSTLTTSLKLPYAAITLGPASAPVAFAGTPGPVVVSFPLTYQSQPVGDLTVSPRSGSRDFDPSDRLLLEELVTQIGMMAHNVRLTDDLQQSRERIVTAREEERRRLRRDLHDGLGAQLAAMALHTSLLKSTIPTDPDAAILQATELQQEMRNAIADIRTLVQGLRPAALDDLGLIGALQTRISSLNLSDSPGSTPLISLNAPDDLGPLPAAVEVAMYRIADEAMTNIIRHASATRATIAIERHDQTILLTIEDDGTGTPPSRTSGVGMQSMRERTMELGGTLVLKDNAPHGTRLIVRIPASSSPFSKETT